MGVFLWDEPLAGAGNGWVIYRFLQLFFIKLNAETLAFRRLFCGIMHRRGVDICFLDLSSMFAAAHPDYENIWLPLLRILFNCLDIAIFFYIIYLLNYNN